MKSGDIWGRAGVFAQCQMFGNAAEVRRSINLPGTLEPPASSIVRSVFLAHPRRARELNSREESPVLRLRRHKPR